MPKIIRAHDNRNRPLIDQSSELVSLSYFNVLGLAGGQEYRQRLPGFESVFVVLSGSCSFETGGLSFENVGVRKDLWSGMADSVYIPAGAEVRIRAGRGGAEISVAGGRCDTVYAPFRVRPQEVEVVEVGSAETHSRRRIFHILGHNGAGRAGNLLVSELYADPGCWSGYPPHKHDTDRGGEETGFEEIYHFRFRPENGFGIQIVFQADGTTDCFMTRSGDTVIIDRGYHPTVTSPGHAEYIFTILVGKTQRSLVQNFKEEYRHLMNAIPGIDRMREKFRQD